MPFVRGHGRGHPARATAQIEPKPEFDISLTHYMLAAASGCMPQSYYVVKRKRPSEALQDAIEAI